MSGTGKMDPEVLSMVLDTIAKLEREQVSLNRKLEMDQKGDFPMELIRFMQGPEIGLHLIFIPEQEQSHCIWPENVKRLLGSKSLRMLFKTPGKMQ